MSQFPVKWLVKDQRTIRTTWFATRPTNAEAKQRISVAWGLDVESIKVVEGTSDGVIA